MIGAHFTSAVLIFLSWRSVTSALLAEREIVFTLLFFLVSAALLFFQWFREGHWGLKTALGWLAILFGFMAVYAWARFTSANPAGLEHTLNHHFLLWYGLAAGVMASPPS